MVRRTLLTLLINMWLSSFPNTTSWRKCLSPLYMSPLLKKTNWPKVYGLISVFSFLFHWSVSAFVPIPCCFNYYSSVVLSEVSVAYAACFVLFLKISLAILSLLWFYINFKIICSNTVENVMGILIGIALSVNFSE